MTKILENLPAERQTFLFSATMVKDYDRHICKELIYGKEESADMVVECGNTEQADADF